MRITLKQLEVFVAIARTGNVSHAAKKMFLSQSACSMALATLEEQLQGSIFDRHGKQLFLNERGRSLLPKATTIISQIKELKDTMNESKKQNLSGQLIVGANRTIGNYLLPQLISDFTVEHQNIEIKLEIAAMETVLSKLLSFKIDVALTETDCYSNKIRTYPWKKDTLVIVASPENILSKKKKLTQVDIVNARWLLQGAESQTRVKLETVIGGQIKPFLELNDTEALKQATQANLGISCFSRIAVDDALKNNKLIELRTPFLDLSRQFHILIHKEKHQSTSIAEFIKKLQSIA